MRVLSIVAFLLLVSPAAGGIGTSLDAVRKRYGNVVPIATDPDLPSYAFRSGHAVVEVVLAQKAVCRISVFFSETPRDKADVLLERFSGRSGWKFRPTDDSEFRKQFAPYNAAEPDSRFYVTDGVCALVKPDSGGAKLMVLIQTYDFPKFSAEGQKTRRRR